MFKKLVAVIAAAAMVMGIGTTAFAAESKQEASPYLEITAEYINTGLSADVDALCQAINAGTKTIADTGANVGSAVALTAVWDVHTVGETETAKVKFPAAATTPVIDKLTTDYTNIRCLHFNIAKGAWEVIKADKVDYTAKKATFTFESCSPVIVIADKSSSGSGGKTSPATGSTTKTAAYATVAGLFALAAVGFAMRRKAH